MYVGVDKCDWRRIKPTAGFGVAVAILSNRISYVFGLKGPSMTIDTLSSASLVATDTALLQLRLGSPVCLAAGTNLLLTADSFVENSMLGAAARNGRCRTFDVSGDGFVMGEGIATVLFKNFDVEKFVTVPGSAVN